MRGKIERLQLNGLTDGRQYMKVQIDGQVYSLWDNKYFDKLMEGQEVRYQWRQSGNFRNLTEIDLNPDKPSLNLNGAQNSATNNNQYNRDMQIARLACLKSASRLLADAQIEPERKKDLVMEYANEFVNRFVYGDRDQDESDIPF